MGQCIIIYEEHVYKLYNIHFTKYVYAYQYL